MKTRWSYPYLKTKMSARQIHEWKRNKKVELTQEYGVGFSCSTVGDKIVFQPFIGFVETPAETDPSKVGCLRTAYLKAKALNPDSLGYISFWAIFQNGALSLPEIMRSAKALALAQEARLGVDRMGLPTSIWIKNQNRDFSNFA